MTCEKCGQQIPDDALFCRYCGNAIPNSSSALNSQPDVQQQASNVSSQHPSVPQMPVPQPPAVTNAQPSAQSQPVSKVNGAGIGLIVAGVAVFIVCCIIQAACGSSMFSTTYYSQGIVQDMIIQVTWWPGWIVSVVLVISGLVKAFSKK